MESKMQDKAVDQKRSFKDFKLLKSSTGIKGLDDITFGGIPLNRPTLLVGPIGSGKIFMAMEYIVNGIEMFNEPGVFMTFEEKTDELLDNVASLGYDIKLLMEKIAFISSIWRLVLISAKKWVLTRLMDCL